jgi:hypothetical protein
MDSCDTCDELMGDLTKTGTALASALRAWFAAGSESPDKRINLKQMSKALKDSGLAMTSFCDHRKKSH